MQYTDSQGQIQSGWLSASASAFGEYAFTTSVGQAMLLAYQICEGDAAGTPVTFFSTNGPATYPYLAGVVGFASLNNDLGPDMFNYVYIGGSAMEVPAGPAQYEKNAFSDASGAREGLETAIWSIGAGGAIAAQWVNTNGAVFTPQIAYIPSSGAFALLGDVSQFITNFGGAYPATWTFVTNIQE
ncbi:uncharacterized protein PHACADRAFT_252442 [Phanerochaete carnosa HHB-10118-sp]|uniref:Uncharacterized protein n=1 Tax=Phanerochaete carnosa (strain HHB-10118-sp) TaxID=650164 RepID=K5WGM4_PHACS|nr:uncharacterized protein PHACADRAFT_252442 [Phanerochaete carnosa HHB-10118-sp]EKM58254.1 hypothetical protein PHACADRAFT_252442 [Phanerochaete carnosa HHB-10118-sp]